MVTCGMWADSVPPFCVWCESAFQPRAPGPAAVYAGLEGITESE